MHEAHQRGPINDMAEGQFRSVISVNICFSSIWHNQIAYPTEGKRLVNCIKRDELNATITWHKWRSNGLPKRISPAVGFREKSFRAPFLCNGSLQLEQVLMLCMSRPCFVHASTRSAQSGTPSKVGQWPQAEQTSKRAGRRESDQPQSTVGDNKATAPNERVAMSSPRWHQRGERNSSACSQRA